MNYYDTNFIKEHIDTLLNFYRPRILHPRGGFHHNYLADGTVVRPGQRQLVSSCRLVVNLCMGYEIFDRESDKKLAEEGLRFLEENHYDSEREAWDWVLEDLEPVDQSNHCYGMAFVVLAYSAAMRIGLQQAEAGLYRAFDVLEKRFWQEHQQLYADEASPDWSELKPYRGQNANMHACEALLHAYETTEDVQFLSRAQQLAETVTGKLCEKSGGLIWEHYTSDLQPDWDYNRDDPKNLYRPWGFQPGHQSEWSKLLLELHRLRPNPALVEKAERLFLDSIPKTWDAEFGGLNYGFAPDGTICDDDKYFWVQAETFAAAAALFEQTGKPIYRQWYDKIWQYSWDHMIDHEHGIWRRLLSRDNNLLDSEVASAGAKCDYHTIGACFHVLKVLGS